MQKGDLYSMLLELRAGQIEREEENGTSALQELEKLLTSKDFEVRPTFFYSVCNSLLLRAECSKEPPYCMYVVPQPHCILERHAATCDGTMFRVSLILSQMLTIIIL